MNNKTNLLEDYVNFVDTTKKQKYFKIIIILFVVIISLFLFFLLFKNHTKYYLYKYIDTYIIFRVNRSVIILY